MKWLENPLNQEDIRAYKTGHFLNFEIKANEYMVDRADTLIAYVKYGGGAEKTLKYAKKQNRTIINLGG